MPQKYVRVKSFEDIPDMIFTFSKIIDHSKFVGRLGLNRDDIVSAGFTSIGSSEMGNPVYRCYGRSVSLDLDSKIEEDQSHLNYQLYSTFDKDSF